MFLRSERVAMAECNNVTDRTLLLERVIASTLAKISEQVRAYCIPKIKALEYLSSVNGVALWPYTEICHVDDPESDQYVWCVAT